MSEMAPRGRRPLVISHAACKGHAPENTLAGIDAAIAFGSDAIEIDVHCTADGVPVLLHDDRVDRTTDGTGDVRELSLQQVQRLDAGATQFEGRFTGERIPTLEEVLDRAVGRSLLVIEVKQRAIEEAILRSVRRLNAADHVMVWSFQPAVIARMRALAPEIPCSQLWSERDPDVEKLCAVALTGNAQAISPHFSLLERSLPSRALLRGLSVFAWTVDEPEEIARVANLGVDGICSNYPDRVRSLT